MTRWSQFQFNRLITNLTQRQTCLLEIWRKLWPKSRYLTFIASSERSKSASSSAMLTVCLEDSLTCSTSLRKQLQKLLLRLMKWNLRARNSKSLLTLSALRLLTSQSPLLEITFLFKVLSREPLRTKSKRCSKLLVKSLVFTSTRTTLMTLSLTAPTFALKNQLMLNKLWNQWTKPNLLKAPISSSTITLLSVKMNWPLTRPKLLSTRTSTKTSHQTYLSSLSHHTLLKPNYRKCLHPLVTLSQSSLR